jgi:hypothetical protein
MLYRCPALYEEDGFSPSALYQDPERCLAAVERSAHPFIWDDLSSVVSSGMVRYDAAAGRRCIDQLDSACLQLPPNVDLLDLDACGDVLEGDVADGGCCCRSEECAGDAYCAGGVCQSRAAMGSACYSSDQCSTALGTSKCDVVDDVCRRIDFAPEAAEGEACGLRRRGLRRALPPRAGRREARLEPQPAHRLLRDALA